MSSVPPMIPGQPPQTMLAALREQIARLEGARRTTEGRAVSSGCPALDRQLPEGGFARGTLVEWLSDGEGAGAETLAVIAAREAARDGGAVVILDPRREFYPPAAVRTGIALEQLILVQPRTPADALWTLDQALRCLGVAAALAWIPGLDGRDFRRLQLAAEEGQSLGLLVRPLAVRGEPSWADVRLLVEPLPARGPETGRRLRLHLLRCRGGVQGSSLEMEIDDAAHPVYRTSPAPPATRRRAGA